jgi:hypothetical protein
LSDPPAPVGAATKPKQRKRSRTKTGSAAPQPTAAKPGEQEKMNVTKMADQLKDAHELASAFTGIESLKLTDAAAKKLAGPVVAVCEKWGLDLDMTMIFGPELGLLSAAVMIYVPMSNAVAHEVAMKRAAANAQPAGEGSTVVDLAQRRGTPRGQQQQPPPTPPNGPIIDQPPGGDGFVMFGEPVGGTTPIVG